MIITYMYDQSSIGLGVYAHDQDKNAPEFMTFYRIHGDEHKAWHDLHRSSHTKEEFGKLITKYELTEGYESHEAIIYHEMCITLRRYKQDMLDE